MLPIIDIDEYLKSFLNEKRFQPESKASLLKKYINKLAKDEKYFFIMNIVKLATYIEDPYQIVKMVETLFEIAEDRRQNILEAYDFCIHGYASHDHNEYLLLSKLNGFSTKKEMDDVIENAQLLFTAHTRPYYRGLLIAMLSEVNQEDREQFVSDALLLDITDDAAGSISRVKEAQRLLISYREIKAISPMPMRLRM